VAATAQEKGYREAAVLKGGLVAWQQAGYKVIRE
jgi:rhodanese-related sulfurtransferase